MLDNTCIKQIVDLGGGVFDNVTASTIVLGLSKRNTPSDTTIITDIKNLERNEFNKKILNQAQFLKNTSYPLISSWMNCH